MTADLGASTCLVIDHNLPGMSGLETIAKLRERRICVPAILITSHPSAAVARQAAKAAVPIVEKPLLENALFEQIHAASRVAMVEPMWRMFSLPRRRRACFRNRQSPRMPRRCCSAGSSCLRTIARAVTPSAAPARAPIAAAPAFRTLSRRYPIEGLAEALGEGLSVGHPDMPEFVFEPDDIGAILDYLKSIQER